LEGEGHQDQASSSGVNQFACVESASNTPQLGVQTELQHPGNHLSVLLANDDIEAIDVAHHDPVRLW